MKTIIDHWFISLLVLMYLIGILALIHAMIHAPYLNSGDELFDPNDTTDFVD